MPLFQSMCYMKILAVFMKTKIKACYTKLLLLVWSLFYVKSLRHLFQSRFKSTFLIITLMLCFNVTKDLLIPRWITCTQVYNGCNSCSMPNKTNLCVTQWNKKQWIHSRHAWQENVMHKKIVLNVVVWARLRKCIQYANTVTTPMDKFL